MSIVFGISDKQSKTHSCKHGHMYRKYEVTRFSMYVLPTNFYIPWVKVKGKTIPVTGCEGP
jgi:hypothetical protein